MIMVTSAVITVFVDDDVTGLRFVRVQGRLDGEGIVKAGDDVTPPQVVEAILLARAEWKRLKGE
jgi:hypothetical protein